MPQSMDQRRWNAVMKYCILVVTILVAGHCFAPVRADIYSWTDEKGVKHFSNAPPADATNVTVEFKEYQYDSNADQQRFEMEQEEWDKIIQDLENDEQKAQEEQQRRAEAAERNRTPTRDERIESEKERLQKKIAALEEKPLEYFGSFDNKRARIGFYRYRLEALMQNPDTYFKEPESFEGNIKIPEDSDSSD